MTDCITDKPFRKPYRKLSKDCSQGSDETKEAGIIGLWSEWDTFIAMQHENLIVLKYKAKKHIFCSAASTKFVLLKTMIAVFLMNFRTTNWC